MIDQNAKLKEEGNSQRQKASELLFNELKNTKVVTLEDCLKIYDKMQVINEEIAFKSKKD